MASQVPYAGIVQSPARQAHDSRFALMSDAIRRLSVAQTHDAIVDIVRHAAREITGAMGVAVVLRDEGHCHYIAEDSAVPLWSGQKFPLESCISGWAMLNYAQAVIGDIYADPRIPHEAYRPTGIHSLIMTPVGEPAPFAALGAYWAEVGEPDPDNVAVLDALAACMGSALQAIALNQSLRDKAADSEARRAESEEASRQVRFQAELLDAVGEAVIASSNDGTVLFWNRAAERHYGWTSGEVLGRSIYDLIPERDRIEESRGIMAQVGQGEPWAGEVRLRRRDGTSFPALVTDSPIRDGSGQVVGVVGVSRDITRRLKAEEHKQLLIHELNHRVKNTLAIVQSLASQSLRGERSFAEGREAFEARLGALADAHALMTENQWRSVSVREVINVTLRAFAEAPDQRFEIDGPDIKLEAKTAVAFALAIHELCTNAAKYGALSTPAGKVVITWRLGRDDAGPRLRLVWAEEGGPPVKTPASRGFGSRLLERGLASELQGEVKLQFEPTGLVCAMDVAAPPEGAEDDALFPIPL